MDLDDDTINRIAQRVAALLCAQLPKTPNEPTGPVRLVDAATLACRLGVRRDWVYRHAGQLGAIRLGGPRGRLRFDLDLSLQRRPSGPGSSESRDRDQPGGSGLGFPASTTYSRKGRTNSGRAARQRPRPDTGSTSHPMQNHRSASGGRR